MISALRAGMLAMLLAACTHHVPATPGPQPVATPVDSGPGVAARDFAARDTTILGAVARTLADSSRIPVRIDPAPALGRAGTAPTKEEADSGDVIGHVEDLVTVALRAVHMHDCSSTLSADDGVVTHTGCPKTRFLMVVFGPPRPGSPKNPASPRARHIDPKPGYWTVPVVVADVGSIDRFIIE